MVLRGFLVCLFFCFVCLFLTQWFSFSDVFLHGLLVWDKRMIALPWISWAVSLGLSFFLRIRQGGPFGDSRRSSFAGVGGGVGMCSFNKALVLHCSRSSSFSLWVFLFQLKHDWIEQQEKCMLFAYKAQQGPQIGVQKLRRVREQVLIDGTGAPGGVVAGFKWESLRPGDAKGWVM